MKLSTNLLLAVALIAAQSPLAVGKGGGGDKPGKPSDDCPIMTCPTGKTVPECVLCKSSKACHGGDGGDGATKYCQDNDPDCGCVAWSIPYCGFKWTPERGLGCNEYTQFIDGGISGASPNTFFVEPFTAMIQGTTSDSGSEYCWEVRRGRVVAGNKIVLGDCNGSDRQLFSVNTFQNDMGEDLVTVSPKGYPGLVVVGVRETNEKAWLRIEEASFALDETQSFYARGSGMVGLGTDPSCDGDDCLFVTNQGLKAMEGDAVMLTTMTRLMRFVKRGDVIRTWTFA